MKGNVYQLGSLLVQTISKVKIKRAWEIKALAFLVDIGGSWIILGFLVWSTNRRLKEKTCSWVPFEGKLNKEAFELPISSELGTR